MRRGRERRGRLLCFKNQKARMNISKSKFMAGAQCLKRLYLQVHQPELAAEPDASGYAIMEQGHEVGLLARQFFPVVWRLTVLLDWNKRSELRES
jgi:hypothetical protein